MIPGEGEAREASGAAPRAQEGRSGPPPGRRRSGALPRCGPAAGQRPAAGGWAMPTRRPGARPAATRYPAAAYIRRSYGGCPGGTGRMERTRGGRRRLAGPGTCRPPDQPNKSEGPGAFGPRPRSFRALCAQPPPPPPPGFPSTPKRLPATPLRTGPPPRFFRRRRRLAPPSRPPARAQRKPATSRQGVAGGSTAHSPRRPPAPGPRFSRALPQFANGVAHWASASRHPPPAAPGSALPPAASRARRLLESLRERATRLAFRPLPPAEKNCAKRVDKEGKRLYTCIQ